MFVIAPVELKVLIVFFVCISDRPTDSPLQHINKALSFQINFYVK